MLEPPPARAIERAFTLLPLPPSSLSTYVTDWAIAAQLTETTPLLSTFVDASFPGKVMGVYEPKLKVIGVLAMPQAASTGPARSAAATTKHRLRHAPVLTSLLLASRPADRCAAAILLLRGVGR